MGTRARSSGRAREPSAGGAAAPPDASPELDAATLVGLLADGDRRRVVAALILGASTLAEVADRAGLDSSRASKALARLADAGLVRPGGSGEGDRGAGGPLVLAEEAFAAAARAARQATASSAEASLPEDELANLPPEEAKVLRSFVRGGRLVSIPVARSKRLVVLDRLAQEFEPGVRYPEKAVNDTLARWYDDTASLRRYLVDEGFLEREAGLYWRAGGTVEVS